MWLPDITCCLLNVDQRRYLRLVALYAPAATVWALAVATLGISEAKRITVLVADGVSVTATGLPLVMR